LRGSAVVLVSSINRTTSRVFVSLDQLAANGQYRRAMTQLRTSVPLLVCFALSGVAAQRSADGSIHDLKCAPGNVHRGFYSAELKPVLTIKSGDTVRVETCSAGIDDPLISPSEVPENWAKTLSSVTDAGPGAHVLTGPIAVEGADPGDVLEIQFVKFEFTAPFGVVAILPTFAALPDDFPYEDMRAVRIDRQARTIAFGSGITLKASPFFGSIGVAPPFSVGRISSNPPGVHGGNLDNRELTEGTTLFLPVNAPGALLSVGDAHAAQGDGEVSCCAVETALTGTMRIVVRKGPRLLWPRAETPTHYISMGFNVDLNKAAELATREMIAFLVSTRHLTRDDALMLCSAAMDLRVTQLVDGTKGVHGMLPKSIFR
jgi:acetamidase/formamidase